MAANTMEPGLTIRWTDRACLLGKMNVVMKANMSTIRKKAMVCLPGPTVASMKVPGAMADKTAKVFTHPKTVQRKEEFGKKANVKLGLITEC